MPARTDEFLARFNAAVTTGDWTEYLAQFRPQAELTFTGATTATFTGLEAITEAYRDDPPDDTIQAFDVRSTEWTDTLRYEWSRGGTGTLWLAWGPGGRLSRLVVDLD